MKYIPNYYKNQAAKYSGVVNKVNGKLDGAMSAISSINSILSVGKDSSNDLLTYNVISGNEEIKNEIMTIQSNLGIYNALINAKAGELDKEEKRAYELYLRLLDRGTKEDLQ